MPDKPPKRCTSSCGDSREDSDRHTHVEGCRFAGREFPQYTASQVAAEKEKVRLDIWDQAVAAFQRAATEFQIEEKEGRLSDEATTALDDFELFTIKKLAAAASPDEVPRTADSRAAKMASEGITEEDVAETLYPTRADLRYERER